MVELLHSWRRWTGQKKASFTSAACRVLWGIPMAGKAFQTLNESQRILGFLGAWRTRNLVLSWHWGHLGLNPISGTSSIWHPHVHCVPLSERVPAHGRDNDTSSRSPLLCLIHLGDKFISSESVLAQPGTVSLGRGVSGVWPTQNGF